MNMKKQCVVILIAAGAALLSGCRIGPLGGIFAEDEYTILLHTASGLNHVQQAKNYKGWTEKIAGWRGLEIVHKTDHSELYWGKYPTRKNAEDDLKTARRWSAPGVNVRAFPFAAIVPIPGKPIIGSPEHDLANAKGYWTILVALFIDDTRSRIVGRKRRRAAVKYCRWLRKQGYEAYYSHGPSSSQVTIGAFPEQSVVMALKGRVHRPAIRDPAIRKIMATKDPPLHFLAVNGRQEIITKLHPKTGKPLKTTSLSYPIRIPNKSAYQGVQPPDNPVNP